MTQKCDPIVREECSMKMRTECDNVCKEQCEDKDKRVCMTVPNQECSEKPVENCIDVPKSECRKVCAKSRNLHPNPNFHFPNFFRFHAKGASIMNVIPNPKCVALKRALSVALNRKNSAKMWWQQNVDPCPEGNVDDPKQNRKNVPKIVNLFSGVKCAKLKITCFITELLGLHCAI